MASLKTKDLLPVIKLFKLLNERAAYMIELAAYKHINNMNIMIAQREKDVLTESLILIKQYALPAQKAFNFIELQLSLAVKIQNCWHKKWKQEGFPNNILIKDLNNQLRPELLSLTQSIIIQLKEVLPLLIKENYSLIQQELELNFVAEFVEKKDKLVILDSLMRINT